MFRYRPIGIVVASAVVVGLAVVLGLLIRSLVSSGPAPPSALRPTAITWGDRVFESRAALDRWLRSKGTTFSAWSERHPGAASVVEHRLAGGTTDGTSIASPTVSEPTPTLPAAATIPAAVTTAAATTPAAVTTPPAAGAGHGRPSPGGGRSATSPLVPALSSLLLVLAVMCLFGGMMPSGFRRRFPDVARILAPYREVFLAAAVMIVVGLILGLT